MHVYTDNTGCLLFVLFLQISNVIKGLLKYTSYCTWTNYNW